MKLTTKMIKDLIREEIEEAKKEEPTLKDVAERLGVPMEEEQVTTEVFDHIAALSEPEMATLVTGLKNLIQVAGSVGGLTIMLDKIADEIGKTKKDKEKEK